MVRRAKIQQSQVLLVLTEPMARTALCPDLPGLTAMMVLTPLYRALLVQMAQTPQCRVPKGQPGRTQLYQDPRVQTGPIARYLVLKGFLVLMVKTEQTPQFPAHLVQMARLVHQLIGKALGHDDL